MSTRTNAKLIFGLLTMLAVATHRPATAAAADSMWLVCTGVMKSGKHKQYIAANVFEHRGSDGGSRDLRVTLLKGGHVWQTHIVGAKVGDFYAKYVRFRLARGKRSIFRGTAKLILRPKVKFAFRGRMDLNFGYSKPAYARVKATLTCRRFDDLSISNP